jgi:uncharacterized protein (DUF4415 family)
MKRAANIRKKSPEAITKMAKDKKKKTPSRLRYEQNHPTVSYRVSKDLYDSLQAVMKAEGKSVTDVLRAGVNLLEVKVRREKEIREEAYLAGRLKGFDDAQRKYSVSYTCSTCGELIVVDSKEEKDFIKTKMSESGWGHSNCIDRGD